MRKVKFTQQTFNEKLSAIIDSFPRLDEIHPFYADLINVLYDRDHYKLSLGQLNTCRHLIENLAKDYVRMLKYGDSLYRCKQVKRACLGRMCTLLKKHKASLAYLEEVRKHLSRLPSIDPNTRSLILCGFPNVGKSSFMNKVTRANVDVQPYAFTTKSLFVGHMDYKYLRWQVLDTPGILDHALEQRNTIEMQSVTALAHLNCCVLYFMDPSQQCGFTVKQQCDLFKTIKPLFNGKPLFVIANKTDTLKVEDLDNEDQSLVSNMIKESGAELLHMSTITEDGVNLVKTKACDKLLEFRVKQKLQSRRLGAVKHRLHVAKPKSSRRRAASSIPESVLRKRAAKKSGTLCLSVSLSLSIYTQHASHASHSNV
jgi:nucleolar GTP-binding protein